MVSVSGLDHEPLPLDGMDFVFADSSIVATENIIISELIVDILEGAAVDSASDIQIATNLVVFCGQ